MPFAFELFFDADTDRDVRKAWSAIAEVSGSQFLNQNGVRPHVALAVVDSPSEEAFHGWSEILAPADAPLVIEEDGRGSFPTGVSFVRFRRTKPLLALHRRLIEFCDRASLQVARHYHADAWVPHCTLAQGYPVERISAVEGFARELRFSCSWTVSSVGLARFPPTVIIDEEKQG